MKYEKPPLTFEQQADLLIGRGLQADRSMLVSRLRAVNYYRLSGYLYPFRESDARLKVGTTLDTVWHLYIFDRQLRMIVMDAIERVEVRVRTQLAYLFSHKCGPFAYAELRNLPGLQEDSHSRWLSDLDNETHRSTEPFIKHFRERYGDSHNKLPIWMLVEVMSFGKTLTFFKGVPSDFRVQIAMQFSMHQEVFSSWLISLNAVRNICAHHGRLWNRTLGYKPKLPNERKHPQWHQPVKIPQDKIFVILTILKYLLKVAAPTSRWEQRVRGLLESNGEISTRAMGFPERWAESPLWL